jgi:hypothetical protein
MKVHELIAKLQSFNKDANVHMRSIGYNSLPTIHLFDVVQVFEVKGLTDEPVVCLADEIAIP